MTHTFIIICVLAAGVSCQRSDRRQEQTLPVLPPPTPNVMPSSSSPPISVEEPLLAEDRVNTSGRDDAPLDETAEEEIAASRELAAPGLSSDRAITQRIRQAVMEDGSFSYSAKSIQIDTNDGVVTLSGPVRSNQERLQLTTLASAMQGVKLVQDQLQVASK